MNEIGIFKLYSTTIKLYEDLSNRNMIGRSVYSLSIEGEGTYIRHIGDDKQEALQVFKNHIIKTLEDK